MIAMYTSRWHRTFVLHIVNCCSIVEQLQPMILCCASCVWSSHIHLRDGISYTLFRFGHITTFCRLFSLSLSPSYLSNVQLKASCPSLTLLIVSHWSIWPCLRGMDPLAEQLSEQRYVLSFIRSPSFSPSHHWPLLHFNWNVLLNKENFS